jgi:hypothetical protein
MEPVEIRWRALKRGWWQREGPRSVQRALALVEPYPGADGQDESASGAGAAYAYELNRDTGLREFSATLMAPDADVQETMLRVSVGREVLLAGALGHDGNASNSGAAYVFRRCDAEWKLDAKLSPSGSWVQVAKLMPSDAASGDQCFAVGASEGLIAVGAQKASAPGVVYLFETRSSRTLTTFCEPSPPQLPNCVPHIETVGSPSASGSGQFFVRSGNIPGGKLGIFLYTHAGLPSPIGSRPGLCLPTSTTGRSLFLDGNETFGQRDGELVLDWNAFVQTQASVDPELAIPGTLIQGQFAYFGLASSDPVGWTDAVALRDLPMTRQGAGRRLRLRG